MGAVGFLIPGAILAMMLTSIRMGFGASGAKLLKDHEGDKLGECGACVCVGGGEGVKVSEPGA